MRVATKSIVLAVALGSSQALAENWVPIYESDVLFLDVDEDSIRRGGDNLVYYQLKSLVATDRAVDCQNRLMYTLKIYGNGGETFPDWRNEGFAIEANSSFEAELEFVCADDDAPADL